MFTRLKGQGIIIEILLFSMSIFLAITTFIVLASQDINFENEASAEIQRQSDLISEKSSLDLMLKDYLWRSNNIGQDKYGDLSASKLTSYYYSTNGEIDVNGNSYEREDVKSDLEDYYSYKLDDYFGGAIFGINGQDYSLNITKDGDNIEVEDLNERPGSWEPIERSIHLSNGETAEITFWIKHDTQ